MADDPRRDVPTPEQIRAQEAYEGEATPLVARRLDDRLDRHGRRIERLERVVGVGSGAEAGEGLVIAVKELMQEKAERHELATEQREANRANRRLLVTILVTLIGIAASVLVGVLT